MKRSFLVLLGMVLCASPLRAQVADTTQADPSAIEDLPRFFADCNRCDSDHLRRMITFVNHVRDPAQAEVYVLITDQETGSGGRQYTLAFSGRGRFENQGFTTTHIARQSETQAQEREGLTHAIMIGLASYAAQTEARDRLGLTVRDCDETTTAPPEDRWDYWTFEAYGGGNFPPRPRSGPGAHATGSRRIGSPRSERCGSARTSTTTPAPSSDPTGTTSG